MKYYPYSVKNMLTAYFGTDTLSAMRKPQKDELGSEDKKHLLPLGWQYADAEAIQLFLEEKYLLDTVIEEDYIVYLYQQGDRRCALLLFVLFEEAAPFSIDIRYAAEIVGKWEAAGYTTKILSRCIGIKHYGQSENFHFCAHPCNGKDASVYQLIENDGRPLLVYDCHGCWQIYYEKLIRVSRGTDIREYQCLFEPTVAITTGSEKSKKTLAAGIEAAVEFFGKNQPVRICYAEFKKTGIYSRTLMAGEKKIVFWVNRRNLISEISFSDRKAAPVMDCCAPVGTESLVAQVPRLCSVRALDITQMHGYAVQMSYSDGSFRNYYLKMFDTLQLPDCVAVEGYMFDEQVLHSVAIQNNGIRFQNGYTIAAHLLFYHSYRQVRAVPTDQKCYRVDGGILQSKYLLPLKEFKNHFAVRHFWGEPGECYGPVNAMLDRDGNRSMDVSFYDDPYGWYGDKVRRVRIEPTARYGFLRKDGTWLAPPIYTAAEDFEYGCAKATRQINGELKQFIITSEGQELRFDHNIDTNLFCGGLCPFNAAAEPVSAPKPGYYWDEDYDEVTPGKWGYINIKGEIIVEPQYVYAVGFYNGGGTRAVVAKLVDGKLRWGAIDTTGKEVIPCIYASLYTRWGDAFAFRRDGDAWYGVMDPDGKVIAQPRFAYFDAYDAEHRMLTVREHGKALGVYSLDRQKMIIPEEYDCVDYGKKIINCEVQNSIEERYFDYSGKELDFSEYDSVSEFNGLLLTRKNQKSGLMELDGTVVIPNIMGTSIRNDCLALYRKGYVITGDYKRQGLAAADGREILPPEYTDITAYENFVIASKSTDANWCICDTLYTYDGKPVLKGTYRRMRFHRDAKELTVETPYGTEHFQLITTLP